MTARPRTTAPPDGLPPPLTAPEASPEELLARLPAALRAPVEPYARSGDALRVVKTCSRIDTGLWRGPARVWAVCLRRSLLLLASGRRPYVEDVPFAELRESLYNHVTGELDLAPAEPTAATLKVAPADGYRMLAQIYAEETHRA